MVMLIVDCRLFSIIKCRRNSRRLDDDRRSFGGHLDRSRFESAVEVDVPPHAVPLTHAHRLDRLIGQNLCVIQTLTFDLKCFTNNQLSNAKLGRFKSHRWGLAEKIRDYSLCGLYPGRQL